MTVGLSPIDVSQQSATTIVTTISNHTSTPSANMPSQIDEQQQQQHAIESVRDIQENIASPQTFNSGKVAPMNIESTSLHASGSSPISTINRKIHFSFPPTSSNSDTPNQSRNDDRHDHSESSVTSTIEKNNNENNNKNPPIIDDDETDNDKSSGESDCEDDHKNSINNNNN